MKTHATLLRSLIVLPMWWATSSATAETCEALRAQIEAKVRATGVQQFSLTVVDAAAKTTGRVVGTCGRGAQKIVYTTKAPAPMLTECKDGSSSVGGTCKK